MSASRHIATGSWIEEGFSPRLSSAPLARVTLEHGLEALKRRLLKSVLARARETRLADEYSWAATEAAALAWCSGFPLLTFPALFEEKIQAAWLRWQRQERVRCGKPVSLAAGISADLIPSLMAVELRPGAGAVTAPGD